MTLPIERFKDAYYNWRYNPFTAADMAVDAEEDALIIPSGSPFLIQLLEQPRYNDPTSVAVRCYGVATTVDADSASGQKVLNVASTTGFSPGDNIIIHRGGAREEEKVIDTVQAGVSLTVTVNLTYTHTAVQADPVEKFIAFTETVGAPAQSQYRVDYPPDDGGKGTGLLEFNSADANKEVRVIYKATGSPAVSEFLDTKLSYPAGTPGDNQFIGFSSGAPIWKDLSHANLIGVSANQHHAQAHTLASHSSKAHSELTGVTSDQHHAQNHASRHHSGGADALAFASIAGFGTYIDQAVKQGSSVIFGGAVINGKFTFGTPTEVTIAGGAITVTRSYHEVDTQGDAGTDNLDTINGFVDGMILVLKAISPTRTVVVRDGTGNIELEGGVNMSLDNMAKKLYLFYDDGTVPRWYEIGRFTG